MDKYIDVYFDIPNNNGYSVIKEIGDIDINNTDDVKKIIADDVYYEDDLKYLSSITELTKDEFLMITK